MRIRGLCERGDCDFMKMKKLPTNEIKKIEREHIIEAISRFIERRYFQADSRSFTSNQSKEYFLRYENQDFDSKVILAIAYEVVSNRYTDPRELDGGISKPYAAASWLEHRGFTIVNKNEHEDFIKKKKVNLSGEDDKDYSREIDFIDTKEFNAFVSQMEDNKRKREIESYSRSPFMKEYALKLAKYCCEVDKNHPSFARKKDGKQYMEPHHIIPLSKQKYFSVPLDVCENIVALCSNCHNEIHYGQNGLQIIRDIYHKRKKQLKKANIFCSEEQLVCYYTGRL